MIDTRNGNLASKNGNSFIFGTMNVGWKLRRQTRRMCVQATASLQQRPATGSGNMATIAGSIYTSLEQ